MSTVRHSGGVWRRPDGYGQWRRWHEWLQATSSADDLAAQIKVPLIDTAYVLGKVADLRARAEESARALLAELHEGGTGVGDVGPADLAELMLAVAGNGEPEALGEDAVPQTPEEAGELLMRGKPR